MPFPLFLDLSSKTCLVMAQTIAGEVEAKIRALLLSGARVALVAEETCPGLALLQTVGEIHCLPPPFRPEYLDGVWLAVSFLTDQEENHRLHQATLERRIFLNVMDRPAFCTAYWPASIRREPLVVAISTGGGSPALAGWLRRRLESDLPQELGSLSAWLGEWRGESRRRLPDLDTRARFWREVMERGLVDLYVAGDRQGAEELLTGLLAQWEGDA